MLSSRQALPGCWSRGEIDADRRLNAVNCEEESLFLLCRVGTEFFYVGWGIQTATVAGGCFFCLKISTDPK